VEVISRAIDQLKVYSFDRLLVQIHIQLYNYA